MARAKPAKTAKSGSAKRADPPAKNATIAALDTAADVPKPKLDWLGKSREWGTRAKPTAHGLTLGALNVGIYGEIPDTWDNKTRTPRGARERAGVPPLGYSLREKHELWADSAADLYEEAIQRRWIPATQVPWDTIEPLPEDVEIAMCQLCTEIGTYTNAEIESISTWQGKMSYGYHEVKMYLATQTFDTARHFEAFRKRALVNGGGLGRESKGEVNRMLLESTGGWTEACAYVYLMRGTFMLNLFRAGHAFAHNEAERVLFARAMQDKGRHLSYGLDHMRYAVSQQADQALILQTVLTIGEAIYVRELRDPALLESLAIIYGGGIDGARTFGMTKARTTMGQWVQHYLDCCDWIGVPRRANLHPGLAQYLESDA